MFDIDPSELDPSRKPDVTNPARVICKMHPLCDNMQMDFGCVSNSWKQLVFWFTIPMLIFNTIFLLVILGRTLGNFKKIRRSTTMTKFQLALIFILVIIQIA